MEHGSGALLAILIVFVAAQLGSELAQRLKFPSVVGQIAAGMAVGPSALAWVKINEPLSVFAEIGAVLLLFAVGLETNLADLRKVGKVALLVGVMGVILPFAAGAGWAMAAGFEVHKALFVAAAFVATSAGITASVLQELGVLSRIESRIILGAAIIDDILAMLILGVVTALQTGTGVDFVQLLKVLAQAIGFVVVVAVVGRYIMRRSSKLMDAPMDSQSPLILSIAICLALAVAAAYTGLAAIIGAFLAGMILSETQHRKDLQNDTKPILAFIVPFFFVVTGMQVNLQLLGSWSVIGMVALVTVLAILSKLIGAAIGAKSLGTKGAMIVGVGMVPRGEVGIIIASIGQHAKIFSDTIYAVIIAMSLLTSIFAPPILKAQFKKNAEAS
ncbi:MAG: cation:proton antiporter [Chlorobia bacterium]|nr:cation:proton antiporter [Fimbriimonadaceae bacterium]